MDTNNNNILHCWVIRKNGQAIEAVDEYGIITTVMQIPGTKMDQEFNKWNPLAQRNDLYIYVEQQFPNKNTVPKLSYKK